MLLLRSSYSIGPVDEIDDVLFIKLQTLGLAYYNFLVTISKSLVFQSKRGQLCTATSCFVLWPRQMRFQNKVVVVSGGGSGIGAALAQAFDQEGAIVAVSDLKGADQVAQSLQNPKSRRGYEVDVTNAKQVQDMIQSIMKEHGRIDIYCSNAGIIHPAPQQLQPSEEFGVVSRHSDAQWNRILQVNLQSHVIAARELLPYWSNRQQSGEKHFLITASAAGLLTQIGDASYGVSKAAAIAFAEHMAIAHGGGDDQDSNNNIHVHCLCPQAVDTPFGDNIVQSSKANSAMTDGVVSSEFVAECCLTTLAETNDFFIFPHPRVQEYCKRKVLEHERWLKGMRKLKRRLIQSKL